MSFLSFFRPCPLALAVRGTRWHPSSASGVGIPPKFNRADRGLYGGKHVITGNTVSFSHRKSRRTWKPNVHKHTLRSFILRQDFKLPVVERTFRTIKKLGGLDNYLLRAPERHIKVALPIKRALQKCHATLREEMTRRRQLRQYKLLVDKQSRPPSSAPTSIHAT
eukprot:gnl/Spiro4/3422_TR1668_c0_g1_i1.p1 gnl/Spiro4/3422_TR1668_c0_g1~~gnl/Spiro4/3422_TR1668_c0_g1_i1.p1  ORF type:complete len:165 (-),score=12.81 gnl/Spiro4/3422_TR1668_c0_g1_i1:102-596(-)